MELIAPIDKAGERVDPGAVQTARSTWVAIATTASAGDEPTDLTTAERTYQTAKAAQIAAVGGDGKIAIFDIPRDWNGIRVRAEGITPDGTYTTQVYAGTLGDGNRDADSTTADCELAYVGQFAWVVGAQVGVTSGYEMADACVVTQSDWTVDLSATGMVRSPGGDRVAEARFDLLGADVLVIVPTVASADSILKARGF